MTSVVSNFQTLSPIAERILRGRYLINKGDSHESYEEMVKRVTNAVADAEETDELKKKWKEVFFDLIWSLDFVPNSPTLMNAGTGDGTLSACYVLPLGDDIEDIIATSGNQIRIEKWGGGVGFPLSNLRPKGYPIRSTQGFACGPVMVLKTLAQNGRMITQGGKRNGAHMAIMSIYHPDVEEFITCKAEEGQIENFNISIGADSNFMQAVEDDKYLHLTFPLDKKIYDSPRSDDDGRYVKARQLFNSITFGAWLNGEPGMVWLDRINEDNATPNLGDIEATNPCGEQPLLGNESCNLGSINVANYVIYSPKGRAKFDMTRFKTTVQNTIRFLDDVITVNHHPTPETQNINDLTRKVGLGLMGWADMLYQLSIPYHSDEAMSLAEQVGSTLKEVADKTSFKLGQEKGDFPEFKNSPLNQVNGGPWANMRNAWRLSIAPTGTIGMIADTSTSIEPQFALIYKKSNLSAAFEGESFYYHNKYFMDAMESIDLSVEEKEEIIKGLKAGESLQSMEYQVEGFDELKRVFVVTEDVPATKHVRIQSIFQKYVDSGISKTINLPFTATEEEISAAYTQAWHEKCKGITVYRAGSRADEVLVAGIEDEDKKSNVSSNGNMQWERPHQISGTTSKVQTGHGSLYVTINGDAEMPVAEVVAWTGKSGACEHASSEAFGRLISAALQHGVPIDEIVDQLKGIECCPTFFNGKQIKSPADGIAYVLGLVDSGTSLNDKKSARVSSKIPTKSGMKCPMCKEDLQMEAGCQTCYSCDWSGCS